LQVINSSPGDLKPVFDSMLERATHLCEATFGTLWTYDGEHMDAAAVRGASAEYTAFLRRGPYPPSPIAHQPLIHGEPVVHIADLTNDEGYRSGMPVARAVVELGGVCTLLAVPLRKDATLLGVFSIYRDEVRLFSDKQIALLQNFAAQAVIAMENARLITETREALEQQTATAEVLQVINASPGDLEPVFDAMLEKAMRLCGAAFGELQTYNGERFEMAALRGLPPRYADFRMSRTHVYGPGTIPARLLAGERLIQVLDITAEDAYRAGEPNRLALADLGGARTVLAVPLVKDDALLGFIVVYRQEIRSFTDKQVALLENFAQQAVIAMENARLITETREALEQQTATAEVLGVINSSPGDLAPVFDAMLEKALRLCEAAFGLLHTYDGERFRALAVGGVSGAEAEHLREWVPDPGSALQQIVDGDQVVHIPDVVDTEAYLSGVASRLQLVQLTGARTALWVALRKDDALVGVFVIYRKEVRPFSEKQVALLQNFAAQAVVAMENARLITETREALQQQTATAEILRVISGSTTDLQPVFQAIVERTINLCDAEFTAVARYEDGLLKLVATNNLSRDEVAAFHSLFPRPPFRGFVMGRAFVERHRINAADVLTDPDYDQPPREVRQSLR